MIKPCLIFIFVCIVHNIITSSVNNYGEFHLSVSKLQTCQGPKRRDCCSVTARMTNASNMFYHIQVLQNVVADKGKIIAIANGQPLVRLQMKNPCDHLFLRPFFRAAFNVTNNCVFRKGNYSFNLDIEDVAQKYYGGMFLYGNLTFKSQFYNNDCNFSCTIVEVQFVPKNDTSV